MCYFTSESCPIPGFDYLSTMVFGPVIRKTRARSSPLFPRSSSSSYTLSLPPDKHDRQWSQTASVYYHSYLEKGRELSFCSSHVV